jgi:hypothetical protein
MGEPVMVEKVSPRATRAPLCKALFTVQVIEARLMSGRRPTSVHAFTPRLRHDFFDLIEPLARPEVDTV